LSETARLNAIDWGTQMKKILSVALTLSLAACATVPSDPTEQGRYYAEQSRQELAKGDLVNGYWDMTRAINRPSGGDHMRSALSDPAIKAKMIEAIDKEAASTMGLDSAKRVSATLDRISAIKMLSPEDEQHVRQTFYNRVRTGNETGMILFMLSGDLASVPPLQDPHEMRIIYDRTIEAYKSKSFASRDMQAVVAYARSEGMDSQLANDFRRHLPELNVRSNELDQVALIDPGFANRRKAQLNMNAHLTVKNADRLFADDVVSRLSQEVKGVTWMPVVQPGALEIVVERVRDAEKVLPIESRTITYSYNQVDILSAALFMPKNASYQFDMKSGGAELEYGYVISAWKNGVKLAENVLRGKLGGAYRKCENPRVINVFGGITAAGFMANDDMKQACSAQNEVSMDGLRSELLGKISNDVLTLPEVSEVHSMNL
jgi:hypothetical protein